MVGREVDESRETEELDRLNGRPPPDGVCVEVDASGDLLNSSRGQRVSSPVSATGCEFPEMNLIHLGLAQRDFFHEHTRLL